jgi:hypothetical protein
MPATVPNAKRIRKNYRAHDQVTVGLEFSLTIVWCRGWISTRRIGPYYGIHHLGESGEAPSVIAREIEATYPGHEPIPPELGDEVVPDVAMALQAVPLGKATIYVCLLSLAWEWGGRRTPAPE